MIFMNNTPLLSIDGIATLPGTMVNPVKGDTVPATARVLFDLALDGYHRPVTAMDYADAQRRLVNSITTFPMGLSIDRVAGMASVQLIGHYAAGSSFDVATITLKRQPDGSFAVGFTVRSYISGVVYFTVAGMLPASAVIFF